MAEIDFDLSNLTHEALAQKLGPAKCSERIGEATSVKWSLSGEPFFLSATFLVFERMVRSDDVPSTVILHGPPLTSVLNTALAGICPEYSEKRVQKLLESEGRKLLPGYKRVQWNENWVVQWLSVRGKISAVVCTNEGLIRRAWEERKGRQVLPPGSPDLP